MKFTTLIHIFLFLAVTSGCKGALDNSDKIPPPNAILDETEAGDFVPEKSGRAYVPIYSNLTLQDEGIHVPLQATVSLRNTDLNKRLRVTKIKYFNTNGDLVRDYTQSPIVIKPLGSHEVVVRTNDLDGGSGAKFLIDWEGESNGFQTPLIEAVFSGIRGSGAFTFSSRAVPLSNESKGL